MKTILHNSDFCVIGGGLAGMCAAIAAARHGLKTVLVHDRPVLGGNASSEIRMWICGAHGENNLETGIIEEIQLENLYRNNYPNYSVWDSILYEKIRFEPNITLLLNCSCNDAVMKKNRIFSIKSWQGTAETWHTVKAEFFADCSGDSILAPLSGALCRIGREAASEFAEDIEPAVADHKTMGLSCLIQARETDRPRKFIPPVWANKYPDKDSFPQRRHDLAGSQNFWWLELGGDGDSIHATENLRDELLKTAFGVWDHIKNHGDHGAENWVLEWVGFLPGKRESRRYIGDY
ncbi:MAG TPA: FAD-dependent oxidoreductase, partial [Spirochaetia bacterium]|nr:FAD-dependent oxidoreductase [Spirochaetia bacterium]